MSKKFLQLQDPLALESCVTFGKYLDLNEPWTWADVILEDPGYVFWLVANTSHEFPIKTLKAAIISHMCLKKKIIEEHTLVEDWFDINDVPF